MYICFVYKYITNCIPKTNTLLVYINNTIFVDDGFGDDQTGIPTVLNKPYKTIEAALNKLKSLAPTEVWNIQIRPGQYLLTTPLDLPPNVNLTGDSMNASIINFNGTENYNYAIKLNNNCGLYNLNINSLDCAPIIFTNDNNNNNNNNINNNLLNIAKLLKTRETKNINSTSSLLTATIQYCNITSSYQNGTPIYPIIKNDVTTYYLYVGDGCDLTIKNTYYTLTYSSIAKLTQNATHIFAYNSPLSKLTFIDSVIRMFVNMSAEFAIGNLLSSYVFVLNNANLSDNDITFNNIGLFGGSGANQDCKETSFIRVDSSSIISNNRMTINVGAGTNFGGNFGGGGPNGLGGNTALILANNDCLVFDNVINITSMVGYAGVGCFGSNGVFNDVPKTNDSYATLFCSANGTSTYQNNNVTINNIDAMMGEVFSGNKITSLYLALGGSEMILKSNNLSISNIVTFFRVLSGHTAFYYNYQSKMNCHDNVVNMLNITSSGSMTLGDQFGIFGNFGVFKFDEAIELVTNNNITIFNEISVDVFYKLSLYNYLTSTPLAYQIKTSNDKVIANNYYANMNAQILFLNSNPPVIPQYYVISTNSALIGMTNNNWSNLYPINQVVAGIYNLSGSFID